VRRGAGLLVLLAFASAVHAAPLRLRAFGDGLPTSGQWRDGFDVADMNGDGHPDVVHGPPRKGGGPPVVFLGDGTGHWRRWSEARFPSMSFDYGAVRAGDLDGDGASDLVVAMHLRGIVALRGDGLGGFQRGLPLPGADPSPEAFASRVLRLADWDRDGRLDVIAFGEGPRGLGARGSSQGVRIFHNAPDGWTARLESPAGTLSGTALALGDVDGDGRADVVTSSSVLGRTDIVCAANADGGCTRRKVDAVPARGYVRAVATADLDGDGRSEIAVASVAFQGETPTSSLDVLASGADGAWRRATLWSGPGVIGVWALGVGDLDGDRHPDLVALTQRGETWVFTGDGHGGLQRVQDGPPAFPGACSGRFVMVTDLDGDRRDEIVASFADEPSNEDGTPHCQSGGGIVVWTITQAAG
jgi:hypothetical protein